MVAQLKNELAVMMAHINTTVMEVVFVLSDGDDDDDDDDDDQHC